jgi:hypothetical protein
MWIKFEWAVELHCNCGMLVQHVGMKFHFSGGSVLMASGHGFPVFHFSGS